MTPNWNDQLRIIAFFTGLMLGLAAGILASGIGFTMYIALTKALKC